MLETNVKINPRSSTPLYIQTKNILKRRILSLYYKRGLPGELNFVNEFGISRGTARKALEELINEGFIKKHQGKNTIIDRFVISKMQHLIPSFTQLLQKTGKKSVIKILDNGICDPPDQIKKLMDDQEQTYLYKRLVFDSGKNIPLALITSYIDLVTVPNFSVESPCSLYELLRSRYDCVPISAKDNFIPEIAGAELAEILNIDAGRPIFKTRRISWDHADRLVECSESYFSLDYMSISISTDLSKNENGEWPMTLKYE